jgi:hapalindole-type alkaloid chlorinase
MTTLARTVRSLEITPANADAAANGIESLYNDVVDIVVARDAFPRAPLQEAGERLDQNEKDPGWVRPNEKMPVEDIQILGTDTPATPTFRAPRGGSLDQYLEGTARHRSAANQIFGSGFDPVHEIERVLARFAAGRPIELPSSSDGRQYAPYTLRRLIDGKQIGIHHDYHYPLDLYSELAPRVDKTTLISWVVTLRQPQDGGELFVYGVTPDTPNAPKMPNGFQYDAEKIEQQFDFASFTMGVGDLFLLASGRCLHRVNRIRGPKARVTMGGFLAFDKDRTKVFYWS